MDDLRKKLSVLKATRVGKQYINIETLLKEIEKSEIVEFKIGDHYKKSLVNVSLSDPTLWKENDMDIVFDVSDDPDYVLCNIVVWGGYNDDKIKFEATVKMKNSFLSHCSTVINNKFDSICESAYIDHLTQEKELWIKSYTNAILNKVKR